MMEKSVCRAITFINYHMPICTNMNVQPQYSTIGYFDGMYTEKIDVDYNKDDLQAMWKYTLRKTAENKGYYSFQNVFGISMDSWNDCEDEYFWSLKANEEYPLTFVVFLQMGKYMVEADGIEKQCRKVNAVLKEKLKDGGISYSYGTIDKNDFIVCIKSRHYKKTVSAIKAIYSAGESVVYSYTIFSVHTDILNEMSLEQYSFLDEEKIDSICLKGITNSMDTNYGRGVTLDQKYREFCDKLICRLYTDTANTRLVLEDEDKKLYDILGDNDFRLIARNVNLRRLLREYAPGGILCYTENTFPYYFFSSSMVFNTLTGDQEPIAPGHREESYIQMQRQQETPLCDTLLSEMVHIKGAIQPASTCNDVRVRTFCQAMFQLLQSLKVLEAAPTKKYDFYSLYYPFAMLVHILEAKLDEGVKVGEHAEVFEFIHKISMTLHGTLRTDIQFFQIKDFNAIVHYAPAKLRAYYALWVLKLSDYYNMFSDNKHSYSFVVAPGMFKGTGVQQLFTEYGEKQRLMLITVPERHIYSPRWLSVILAHEVQHVVGTYVRCRKERHVIWIKMTARILELELQSFFYVGTGGLGQQCVEELIKNHSKGLRQIERQLLIEEKDIRRQKNESQFEFHWKRSCNTIHMAYLKVIALYIKQIVFDYSYEIKDRLLEKIRIGECQIRDEDNALYVLRDLVNGISEEMLSFCKLFEEKGLEDILGIIKYISGESLADMTAIFSLSLSPESYIQSFGKMEVNNYVIEDVGEGSVPLLSVRIALVSAAVSETLERHKEWMIQNDLEFYNMWQGDVLHEMAAQIDCVSLVGRTVKWACDYYDYKFDFTTKIRVYERMYSTQEKCFSNTSVGFLSDVEIWKLFQEYLRDCADAYFQQLKVNNDIKKAREKIISSYQKIAGNSVIDLMQEIDIFLEQNEK